MKRFLKLIFVCFSFFLFFSSALFADRNIDSLHKEIANYKKSNHPDKDSLKQFLYQELSGFFQSTNSDSSMYYAYKALEMAYNSGSKSRQISAYTYLAGHFTTKGAYENAIQTFYKAYYLSKEIDESASTILILNHMGNIFYHKKAYDQAFEFYKRSIDVAEKFYKNKANWGNINPWAVGYNNVGLVYRQKFFSSKNEKFLDTAIIYIKKGLEIRKKTDDMFLIAHSYLYLAKLNDFKHDTSAATYYFNQIWKLIPSFVYDARKSEMIRIKHDFYLQCAIFYINNRQVEKAEKFINTVMEKEADSNAELKALISMVKSYIAKTRNQIPEAVRYAKDAIEINRKISNSILNEELYEYCLKMYDELGNYKDANSILKDIIEAYKEQENSSALDALTYMKSEKLINETQAKIKEIEDSNKEKLRFEQIIRNASIVASTIALILGVLFYSRYRMKSKNNEFLNAVINSLSMPFYVINKSNSEIILVNNTVYDFLEHDEFINSRIEKHSSGQLFYKDHQQLNFTNNFEIGVHDYLLNEVAFVNSNGDKKVYAIYNFPYKSKKDSDVRIIEYIMDITIAKNSQEQLELYANELSQLNATKDKFFSIISHDLKGPVSGITISLEFLEGNFEELESDKIKEFISMLYSSSSRLYKLIEELLQWSRLQTRKIESEFTRSQISMAIESAYSSVITNATLKLISIESEICFDPIILIDTAMINTVLRNLLSNAVKFSNKNDTILVRTSEYEGMLLVEVIDHGVGMKESDLEKLFRIDVHFSTVGTNEERGTGLGLVLCKELVEIHKGKIWAESKHGEGSVFKFTLPYINK